jgi:hypothetical protein
MQLRDGDKHRHTPRSKMMQIPILIEKIEKNGYRATAGFLFDFTVEALTRDEVLHKARAAIAEKIRGGAEVVQLDLPLDNPWLRQIGIQDPNDPFIQDWKAIMEENRRTADETEKCP